VQDSIPVQGFLSVCSRFNLIDRSLPLCRSPNPASPQTLSSTLRFSFHTQIRSTALGINQPLCRFLLRILALPGQPPRHQSICLNRMLPLIMLSLATKGAGPHFQRIVEGAAATSARDTAGLRELSSLTVPTCQRPAGREARTLG
jgi:hypothetical protein